MKNHRRMLMMMLLGGAASCVGCRAVPVGFVVALARDGIQELDMHSKESKLINRHPAVADDVLGRRLDTLRDVNTSERCLRYPIPNLLQMEEFYFLRVSGTDKISHMSRWLGGSDGLEDVFKRSQINKKVIGHRLPAARRNANLMDPIFVFANNMDRNQLVVFDVTNFTHLRPRLLVLTLDKAGVCRDAQFYGVASGGDLRVPSQPKTAKDRKKRKNAPKINDPRSDQPLRTYGAPSSR